MSQWLSEVIATAQTHQDWLAPHRQAALAELEKVRWPLRKVEDWRFTPLIPVEKRSVSLAKPENTEFSAPKIGELSAIELVFSGNELLTDVCALSLPEGLEIVRFSSATAEQQQVIESLLSDVKPAKHLFG